MSSVTKSQDLLALPLFKNICPSLTAISKVAQRKFTASRNKLKCKCNYEIEQLGNQYIID